MPVFIKLKSFKISCNFGKKESDRRCGLYIFYLPPYSPQLNIAETLWRKIKKEQIDRTDYVNKDTLFYAANRCLAQFGVGWKIRFSNFNIQLIYSWYLLLNNIKIEPDDFLNSPQFLNIARMEAIHI
jgi:hypothetical protein